MAHSLSAKKRVRQNAKQRTTNRARKSQVKSLTKGFDTAIAEENIEEAEVQLHHVAKKLDKTASTSTMHKNTASRKKSRLTKKLNVLKTKSKK